MKCLSAKDVASKIAASAEPSGKQYGRRNRSYCVCKCKSLLVQPEELMISCSSCNDWFHLSCMEMSQREAKSKKSFKCPQCVEHNAVDLSPRTRSLRLRSVASNESTGDGDDMDEFSNASSAGYSISSAARRSPRKSAGRNAHSSDFESDGDLGEDEGFLTAGEHDNSDNESVETVVARGRVKGAKAVPVAAQQPTDSCSASSESEETIPTDDEERKMLEEEELQIQLNGIDSDEEDNIELPEQESSDDHGSAHSSGHTPVPISQHIQPIVDPNEIDHVWSSTDDEHYFDLQQQVLHSDGSPSTKNNLKLKQKQLLPQQQHNHKNGKKSKCSHPACRRNKKTAADSASSRIDDNSSTEDSLMDMTADEMGISADFKPSSSNAAAAATLTPAMIQTYLAGRGVQISDQHAVKLSENIASGIYNLPMAAMIPEKRRKAPTDGTSLSVSSANTKQFASTDGNSGTAVDEKVFSKEAKQFEALQAQAVGGYISSMGSLLTASAPTAAAAAAAVANNNSANSGPSSNAQKSSAGSGKKSLTFSTSTAKSPGKERLDFITVDDLLQINPNDSTQPSSQPAGETAKLNQRWDKIPIGTFRRSRKISAPILKLSLAVRSTFGVVPQSIHETLSPADSRRRPFLRRPNNQGGLALVTDSEDDEYYNVVECCESSYQQQSGYDSCCGCSTATASATEYSAASGMEDSTTAPESNGSSNDDIDDDGLSESDIDCTTGRYVRSRNPYYARSQAISGSMRFAVSTTDLSQFVEDSSHPPSACASPSTVPMMFLSPVLGAGGRGSSSSMLSSSMERLDIGPSGLLADIGEELVMSGNFSRKQINSSLPKRGSGVRKRRRSSICLNDILASFN